VEKWHTPARMEWK